MTQTRQADIVRALLWFAAAHPGEWVTCDVPFNGGVLGMIRKGLAYGAREGQYKCVSRKGMAWVKALEVDFPPTGLPEIPGVTFDVSDPPEDGRGLGEAEEIRKWLELVRHINGVWIRRDNVNVQAAYDIRHGRKYGAKPGEFITTNRRTHWEGPNRADLYVQYIGPKIGEAPADHGLWFDTPPVSKHTQTRLPNGELDKSPITTWLREVVRPNVGEPMLYPDNRHWHRQTKKLIEEGLSYGAGYREFDVRVSKPDGKPIEYWVTRVLDYDPLVEAPRPDPKEASRSSVRKLRDPFNDIPDHYPDHVIVGTEEPLTDVDWQECQASFYRWFGETKRARQALIDEGKTDEFPQVAWSHGLVPEFQRTVLDQHELMNWGEFEALHSESAKQSWLMMHPRYDDDGNLIN